MAVWFLFNELAVFLVLLGISTAERDLLDTLHVDQSNPRELNEFLSLLLRYKDEFRWIRQAALNANADLYPASPLRANSKLTVPNFQDDFDQPPKPNDFSFLKRSVGRPENDVYPYVFLKTRNLRRKQKQITRGRRRQRRSNVSVNFNVDSEQDSGEVNVVPRSETGVQNVPGNKYGSKRYEKREQKPPPPKPNTTAPPSDSSSSSKLKNSSEPDSEYYYTSSHDVLGLAQDLSREFEDRNMSCVNQRTRNPCRDAPQPQKKDPPQTKAPQAHSENNLKHKLLLNKFLQHHINSPMTSQHPIAPSLGQSQLAQPPLALAPPPQNITPVPIKNPKLEEIEKLWRFVEAPQKAVSSATKEELLKDEGDNVLANIDRLLKSDRSGLKMYRGVPNFQAAAKKRDEEALETENANFESFNSLKALASLEERPLKRIRDVNGKDYDANDSSMDVELKFNSEPQEEYCAKKKKKKAKTKRRHGRLHKPKGSPKVFMIPLQPGMTPVSLAINSDDLRKLHHKKLKDADDIISDDLKATVKAYESRQNEYKSNEEPSPELAQQERKNLLEDQSEPTSAAEQRELAKQDEFVTPSMNESDTQALIVIPLKKAANAEKNDYETPKEGGFKVKESKDVIHIKGHKYVSDDKENIEKKETKPEEEQKETKYDAPEEQQQEAGNVDKKETKYDAPEDELSDLYTKEVFDKIKGVIANSVNQNDYTDAQVKQKPLPKTNEDVYEDTAVDKLDPSNIANLDYDYYENFDQKREAPAVEATVKFQSRQLKYYVDLDYRNGNVGDDEVRKKRYLSKEDDQDFDTADDEETDKQSEDEDSDEEPGNDSKKASYKKKTKEEKISEICITNNATSNETAGNTTDTEGTIKFELTTTYSIKLSDLLNKTNGLGSSGKGASSSGEDECIPDVSNNSNGSTGEANNYKGSSDEENDFKPGSDSNDTFGSDMDEPTFGSYHGDNSEEEPSPKKSGASYNYFNVTINLVPPQECETTTTSEQFSSPSVVKKVNSTKFLESTSAGPQAAAHGPNSAQQYFLNESKFNETKTSDTGTEILDSSQTTNTTNITSSNVPNLDSDKRKLQPNRSFIESGFDLNCFNKNYLSLRGKNSANTPRSVVLSNLDDDEDEIDRNDKMHDSGSIPNVNRPVLDRKAKGDARVAEKGQDNEEEEGEDEAVEDNPEFTSKQEELLKKLKDLVKIYSKRVKDLDDKGAMAEREVLDNVHGHGKGKKKPTPTTKAPTQITPKPTTQKLFPEKHVLHPHSFKDLRVIEEGYYEPESMADDLKERLLVEKLYNAVIKKRRMDDSHFDYYDDYKETCPVDLGAQEDEQADDDYAKQRKYEERYHKRRTKNKLRKRKQTAPQARVHLQRNLARVLQKLRENKNKRLAPRVTKKEAIRLKLDNVESFKDVVEHDAKRRVRNLNDFTESYLSPLVENDGIVNHRKRRRLKYLERKGKVARQVNSNHYFIKNLGQVPQKNVQMLNFIRNQNSNVETSSATADPKSDNTNTSAPMQSNSTEPSSQYIHKTNVSVSCSKMGTNKTLNCTEVDALRYNQSLQIEADEKMKEHEDMRKMLNGNLALKLIDVFVVKLKDNPTLYNKFGKFISRTCAEEDVKEIKDFREDQAKDDIRHAEEMLHEVIVMLNKIVGDQVNRKTCLRLAPALKTFVVGITKNLRNLKKNNELAEGFPLPKIKSRHGEEPVTPPAEEEQGNFLFELPDTKEHKINPKLDINKKIKLIEKLLDKYQRMSMNCQVQVEPVKNYLMQHLSMLMHLMEKSSMHSTECVTIEDSNTVNVKEQEIAPPQVHHNKSPVLAAETQKIIGEAPGGESQSESLMDLEENSLSTQDTPGASQPNVTTSSPRSTKPQETQRNHLPEQKNHAGLVGPSKTQAFVRPNFMQYPLQTRNEEVNNNLDQFQTAELEQSAMQQPPPQAKPQHPQNLKNTPTANSSETTEAIVANQLQSDGKFANPELVNKNLLSLGLGGANSYLPPFDINGMVQEGMIKSQIAKTPQAAQIPSNLPPANPAPGRARRTMGGHGDVRRYKRTSKGKEGSKLYEQTYAVDYDDDKVGNIKSTNQEAQDLMGTSGDAHSVFVEKL